MRIGARASCAGTCLPTLHVQRGVAVGSLITTRRCNKLPNDDRTTWDTYLRRCCRLYVGDFREKSIDRRRKKMNRVA